MQTILPPPETGNRSATNAANTSAPVQRFAFIEGMRAVAALVVIWNHVFAEVITPSPASLSPALNLMGNLMVLGHLSVTTFIVLSGFCLMLPLVKAEEIAPLNLGEFFRRRARRILPPYYFALILCLLLAFALRNYPMGIHYDSVTAIRTSDIAAHFLLIHNVFGTGKINYVFWSIATEWQLYFLFPVLIALFRRFGVLQITLTAVVAGLALYALAVDTRMSRMNLHYLGFFAMGMMAARIALSSHRRWSHLQNPVVLRALILLNAAVVILLLANLGWRDPIREFVIYDIFVAVATFATLILCTRQQGLLRRFFSWKPFAAIGTFSYSVYLMHVPVLALLLGLVVRPLGLGRDTEFWILATVGTGMVIGTCYLFFWCFERPFLRPSAHKPADTGIEPRPVGVKA